MFIFVRVTLLGALAAGLLLIGTSSEAGVQAQFALHRPSTAQFFFDYADGSPVVDRILSYGGPNDVALLADFDGDTIADLALYRNGVWFINLMNDGIVDGTVFMGGGPADRPIAGDFLGSGKAGIGIFRNGVWYLSTQPVIDFGVNVNKIFLFGGPGDLPIVADFDGDGKADCAVYRPSNGFWFFSHGCTGTLSTSFPLGGAPGDLPFAGDFSGNGQAGMGIFRNGTWFVSSNHDGVVDQMFSLGGVGDRPLIGPLNPMNSRFVRQGAFGGDGSQAAPFGTIAQALASPPPGGVTIRIAAGTYPEAVSFSSLQNITFLGAGLSATHLTGSPDAFVAAISTNITLRNLHVASPNGRGIIAQGTTMTLDGVSTVSNKSHGVLATGYLGNSASLLVQSSTLSQSQSGSGLRLEGGVTATVQGTSIDGNNRGVELFGDSVLLLEHSSVSHTATTGILATSTARATIRYNSILQNGQNGIYFELQTSGDVYGNQIDGNGTLGAFGSGYNGIEIAQSWNGSQMVIHENSVWNSTAYGVFIGGGQGSVVANNHFFGNFVGVSLESTTQPTNAVVRGNLFELNVDSVYEEGVFLDGSLTTATLGFGDALNRNTYRNYRNEPAIHCINGATSVCQTGSNVFQNCNMLVVGCNCSP